MENWMVLVVSAAVILLGFAFLASLIYTDHVSERKRVLICAIPVLLIAALVIFFVVTRDVETNEDSSLPAKTATTGSSIAVNEEDKPYPSVVEPNDTTEAGPFVSENYEKSYRSLRYELDLELRGNPWVLARYLYAYGVLDEFGPSVGQSAEVAVNAAASIFLADDSIRKRAYEKAVELFSDAIVDADWKEFKKAIPRSADFDTYEEYQAYLRNLAAPTKIRPLARIAETGETISTEPAGPWEGPSD